MKIMIAALGAVLALAACGAPAPAPAPVKAPPPDVQVDELTIDTLPGGQFRGRAGGAWTREEVTAQAASMECGGRALAAMELTPLQGGGHSFSGRC